MSVYWDLFAATALTLTVVYALYLLRLLIAWLMTPESSVIIDQASVKMTVIVAARDEAHQIGNLLSDLALQTISPQNWELIIVDDQSDDATAAIVLQHIELLQSLGIKCKLLHTESANPGKKAAIELAIGEAANEIVVTTDADVRISSQWLQSIASCFNDPTTNMVVGAVNAYPAKSFFEKLQSAELAVLNMTGYASLLAGSPLLCNGANLAFRKKVFLEVGGYQMHANIPSGDDTFLMLSIHHQQPGSVKFMKNRLSVVTTPPAASFSEFVQQRKRWISKVKSYKSKNALWSGALGVGVNASLIAAFILWGCFHTGFLLLTLLLALKGIPELLLFITAHKYLNRQVPIFLFLPLFVLMPVYFLISGRYLLFSSNYVWKNRNYKV